MAKKQSPKKTTRPTGRVTPSRRVTPNRRDTQSKTVRLNKFIADCGVTSRRKADELIEEGSVKLNGKTTYELGLRIDPNQDRVRVKGKPIGSISQQKVYFMFNKPKSVLTSMDDPEGRPTVADFFRKQKARLFPVGRLDWDSEGLLLMTNDGNFSQKVTHPKEEIPKTYLVKLDDHPSDAHLLKLRRGVSIVGGKVKALHIERIRRAQSQSCWIKIVIAEGKNRQVRKMFEKIGFDVKKLQRVAIGQLSIGKLKRGEFSELSTAQLGKIFASHPANSK